MDLKEVFDELVDVLYLSEAERDKLGVSDNAARRASETSRNAESRQGQAWSTQWHHQKMLLLRRYKRRLDELTMKQLCQLPTPSPDNIAELSPEGREALDLRIRYARGKMYAKYNVDVLEPLPVVDEKYAIAECIGFLLSV